MVRKLLRPAAVPITWLLLHTPISANQVTFIALLTGLMGNVLLSASSNVAYLAAVALLQLWYLLDHVDGQIARYRKSASLTGRFYDFLMHHVIHGTVFCGLGWYFWKLRQGDWSVFLMISTPLCMILFNLLHDIQYKTFHERLAGEKSIRLRSTPETQATGSAQTSNTPKRIFSFLHKSCEMHIVMNVLTLSAILEALSVIPFDSRLLLMFYYSVVIPFITVSKITYIICSKQVDQRFHSIYDINQ